MQGDRPPPGPTERPSLNLVGSAFSRPPREPATGKVLSYAGLLAARHEATAAGRRVVQCHGCFDIVHPGHIRHLRQARAQGDALLVTITGDTEMKKGTGRPLIPEELRAENLAALDCVDWVYIEQRPSAAELLGEVRPDVYVKGAEYEFNGDARFRAEREAVERHGGRVVFSSGDVVFSSTALIAALEHSADPYHARLSQLLDNPELDGVQLTRLISAFRGKRVVVVGEAIIDTYVLCDRPQVAGESPIMTLRPVERRVYDGGAAVIARHLAAMGALPVLVTGLAPGEESDGLRHRLMLEGVEVRSIDISTRLPEKQRFLVGGQKVMKLDLLEPVILDASRQDALVELAVETAAGENGLGCDAAIVADFGQGLLSPGVLVRLCASLRPFTKMLTGDVSGRRASLLRMAGMDLLCPTENELRDALNMFDESLPGVTWRLMQATGAKAALVTLGAEGLVAFNPLPDADRGGDQWGSRLKGEHVPALCAHAVDPLGCGDALLAAATLALASGGSLLSAAFLGSLSAACEAQRLGNIVVSASDLRQSVARVHSAQLAYSPSEVIQSRSAANGPARSPYVHGARIVISYIIPTHNRAEVLAGTLAALGSLPSHRAEVIVVDNASDVPATAPPVLQNGIPVAVLRQRKNAGAAGRNVGAQAADRSSSWLVMLDDDSYPVDTAFVDVLRTQVPNVGAVAAEISLEGLHDQPGNGLNYPPRTPRVRESGGLPEVFIGCGVAIRKDAFVECGGYDASFGYYAEEYDLSAKLLLSGMRVRHDRRFKVVHRKAAPGRDMNAILSRLVRNNGWVSQRYSPAEDRRAELREVMVRYAAIAAKEKSIPGYTSGAAELLATLRQQERTPMSGDMFARFTGLAEARRSIGAAFAEGPFRSACIVDEGKNSRFIRRALSEHGVRITIDPDASDALVIGTLSPGPLLDSWERRRSSPEEPPLVSPWRSLSDHALCAADTCATAA